MENWKSEEESFFEDFEDWGLCNSEFSEGSTQRDTPILPEDALEIEGEYEDAEEEDDDVFATWRVSKKKSRAVDAEDQDNPIEETPNSVQPDALVDPADTIQPAIRSAEIVNTAETAEPVTRPKVQKKKIDTDTGRWGCYLRSGNWIEPPICKESQWMHNPAATAQYKPVPGESLDAFLAKNEKLKNKRVTVRRGYWIEDRREEDLEAQHRSRLAEERRSREERREKERKCLNYIMKEKDRLTRQQLAALEM